MYLFLSATWIWEERKATLSNTFRLATVDVHWWSMHSWTGSTLQVWLNCFYCALLSLLHACVWFFVCGWIFRLFHSLTIGCATFRIAIVTRLPQERDPGSDWRAFEAAGVATFRSQESWPYIHGDRGRNGTSKGRLYHANPSVWKLTWNLVFVWYVCDQTPSWLEEMISFSPWRELFYQLAEQYPNCLMLKFTIKVCALLPLLSNLGYEGKRVLLAWCISSIAKVSSAMFFFVWGVQELYPSLDSYDTGLWNA